ncbi:MAG: hypothetical protein ACXWP6_00690 [Ktedonobacterales bacterium]
MWNLTSTANDSSIAQTQTRRPPRRRFGAGWSRSQWRAVLAGLVVATGMAFAYVYYVSFGRDVSPDSLYGYAFAIAGTLLLVAVGVGYTVRKRVRGARRGLLHTALSFHIVGGILALGLIMMHAVGNFHPRTGTYALVSLIALVVSGIIGKQLDRVAPRIIAKSALKTVTGDGEERLESLMSALDATRHQHRERRKTTNSHVGAGDATASTAASIPWDLAYYDLSVAPSEIPSLLGHSTNGGAHRPPSETALAAQSGVIGQAIGVERLFQRLIRVWRLLHTLLSILTLVLILWHLEYAATLLLNTR